MKYFVAGLLAQEAVAAATRDSTVSKVISLLEELEGKVQADLKKEGELMLDFEKWCDTSKTEADYAIKDDNRIISEQSALLDAATGNIESATAAIEDTTAKIGAASTEKDKAEKVRADEHKLFLAKEKELVEAGDMLVRAHQILKRSLTSGLSFAQGGQQKIEQVVGALSAIVAAASVFDPAAVEKVKSFADESNELRLNLAQAPQATVSAYESKSGGILKSIADLRDETSSELRKTRTAEINAKHAHELLVQSLTNELESLNKMLTTEKGKLAKNTADKGAAEKKLAQTQDELASDEKYLDSVVHDCEAKFAAWKEHQETATAEMTALSEAKDVLSSRVVVLAQVSTATRRMGESSEKRERVISMLRSLGRRFNSFGLLQAASSAEADPFEKVRGLIKEMIAKLEKQAQEEMSKKQKCDKEIAETTKKLANKNAALDKYTARHNKATARSNKVASEIKELQVQIKELKTQLAEATAARNAESAENKQVIDDNNASAAAVADAIAILKKFYGDDKGISFAQGDEFRNTASRAAAPDFDFAAKRSGGAHSIIGVLETAQADFTELELKTKADEEGAAANYVTYKQNTEVTIAKKEALVVGKTSEKESLKVQIGETTSDIENTTSERDAVQDALNSLHEECANKAMSYEERVQRRDAEIAGLKEALEVLSEDAMATSFLQRRN